MVGLILMVTDFEIKPGYRHGQWLPGAG